MVFLVALFFLKNGLPFKKNSLGLEVDRENALLYGDNTVSDLVYKDTDDDGVPDWEETLWGLDPLNKETTPGTPDSTTVEKMSTAKGSDTNDTNLTETDKFSRELFSTVAALNQDGLMDQTTVDEISSSLFQQIKTRAPSKVFLASDLQATDDTLQAIRKYNSDLETIYKKYPPKGNAMAILSKFIIDENNVDSDVLLELNPLMEQTNNVIRELSVIKVPKSFISLHLEALNGMQRLLENVSDITLYDTDPVIALGGITQYNENNSAVIEASKKIEAALALKLKTNP